MQLTDIERRDWLRLSRTDRIGPVTFHALIARFGSAGAALDALPDMAKRGGGKSFTLPDPADAARELDALAKRTIRMAWPPWMRRRR